MKKIFSLFLLGILISCSGNTDRIKRMQHQIDSLKTALADTYKPGFGELMTGVQAHHSKLWFAGKNRNWELAGFEIKEINEILDDVLKYQQERKETQFIEMISPELEKVKKAISRKDPEKFKTAYENLTRSCNECHQVTNFKYNIVRIPDISPFTNQSFKMISDGD